VRLHDQEGSALVEVTWLAILLLVPLHLEHREHDVEQRAAFGVSSGARAAARSFAQAPSEATAPDFAARAARLAMADQGLEDERRFVEIRCTPDPVNCLAPGSMVTVAVRYAVPLPLLPPALGQQRPSVRVEAEHSVPYGTYREDLQ
jgi:hypothetical protein